MAGMNPNGKYAPFIQTKLETRDWPSKVITKAPLWCSVDLRDGNQALVNPMGIDTKLAFFDLLCKIGFKEIEIGFPAASETEFEFCRRLIDENRIPEDVTIQVLCQARDKLVHRTVEAIRGAKNVIFHIYNSTSINQRKYTFNKSKEEIKQIAIDGVKCIRSCLSEEDRQHIRIEYSPESFSMTEIDYALEVCEAVKETWQLLPGEKIIFNLPTTVECYTPNVYADSIEYFSKKISERDKVIISTHCHNDRGTGVASAELALLAGADRTEGCIFGNGERTGNLDIVNVALNMYSQGVDPELDFHNLPEIAEKYTQFTEMEINPRTPYVGELVFTAFSGSHQDAIRKGMASRAKMDKNALWDVPYLLIDPHDIGRQYEGIIRINSQSGKGGSAYILEEKYGIILPKAMHPALGEIIKNAADKAQRELKTSEIYDLFVNQWLEAKGNLKVLDLAETHLESKGAVETSETTLCRGVVEWKGEKYTIGEKGNGPLDAFASALKNTPAPAFSITAFHEHSVGTGNDTSAIAYVQITCEDGNQYWGAGKSTSVGRAGVEAVVSALNQIK
ncbi:MAG: 2-isopropylmalate synthase [Spirochaetales bacterium]|nr:2-isopropylmalate synthase [Spirochaetales bacterium]